MRKLLVLLFAISIGIQDADSSPGLDSIENNGQTSKRFHTKSASWDSSSGPITIRQGGRNLQLPRAGEHLVPVYRAEANPNQRLNSDGIIPGDSRTFLNIGGDHRRTEDFMTQSRYREHQRRIAEVPKKDGKNDELRYNKQREIFDANGQTIRHGKISANFARETLGASMPEENNVQMQNSWRQKAQKEGVHFDPNKKYDVTDERGRRIKMTAEQARGALKSAKRVGHDDIIDFEIKNKGQTNGHKTQVKQSAMRDVLLQQRFEKDDFEQNKPARQNYFSGDSMNTDITKAHNQIGLGGDMAKRVSNEMARNGIKSGTTYDGRPRSAVIPSSSWSPPQHDRTASSSKKNWGQTVNRKTNKNRP